MCGRASGAVCGYNRLVVRQHALLLSVRMRRHRAAPDKPTPYLQRGRARERLLALSPSYRAQREERVKSLLALSPEGASRSVAHAIDTFSPREQHHEAPIHTLADRLRTSDEPPPVHRSPPTLPVGKQQQKSHDWVEKHRSVLEEVLPASLEMARGSPRPIDALARALSFSARSLELGAVAKEPMSQLQSVQGEYAWRRQGGDDLEALLGGSDPPVALVRADYLIQHAKSGKPIGMRQELPPEAFISLHELKAACHRLSGGLPVVTLS